MRPETILRWTARAWGIASTWLLCAFAFGGGEHLRITAGEAALFLFFPVGVVAGFVIAWWRELAGGLITVGSLAAFYVSVFAVSGRWPAGPYFLLFAAPGILHVTSALLARRGGRATPVPQSG
jgi:hypothetical protein